MATGIELGVDLGVSTEAATVGAGTVEAAATGAVEIGAATTGGAAIETGFLDVLLTGAASRGALLIDGWSMGVLSMAAEAAGLTGSCVDIAVGSSNVNVGSSRHLLFPVSCTPFILFSAPRKVKILFSKDLLIYIK